MNNAKFEYNDILNIDTTKPYFDPEWVSRTFANPDSSDIRFMQCMAIHNRINELEETFLNNSLSHTRYKEIKDYLVGEIKALAPKEESYLISLTEKETEEALPGFTGIC